MNHIEMREALKLCQEAELLPIEEREKLVKKRLRELVFYAKEHSPYYKNAYKNIEENFTLSDLPPTTKKELMADYSAWVTDPSVREEEVISYIHSPEALDSLYLGKYTALSTSGTTGNPMPMVRDSYHNTIHGAMIQTRLLRGVDADIMSPVKHKIASVLVLDSSVSSYAGFLKMQKAYPEYEQNTLAISLTEDIDIIVRKLNEFQPDFITGYPSIMAVVGKACEEGKLQIHPQAIACSAETLTDKAYKLLSRAFQCPILNNYCSTEGGEAAMFCREGKFHVNSDWVIIEPVDKNGNPVPEGTWSEGIYITDLTNYVQPVIRYYMEDKIRVLKESCRCGSSLPVLEIQGRTVSSLTVGQKELFGLTFEKALGYVEGILSVQLVQKADRKFLIRLIPEFEDQREEVAKAAQKAVLGVFERNGVGEVEVLISQEPPVHNKRGGKVSFVVKELEVE